MPEQTEYLDKYLEAKFTHIDASVQSINNAVNDLKGQFTDLRGQFTDFRKEVREELENVKTEVKADNKSTRWWIVGTAITVLVGFAAISVAIFFGFSQLQTSWIQSAFSLVGKAITK